MGLLWYVVLAVLFLGVVFVAVPRDDKPAPPPDPHGVMMQMKSE